CFFPRPTARGLMAKAKARWLDPQIRRHLDYVEGELGTSAWLAGDEMTAADIQLSYPLEAAVLRTPIDAGSHPRVFAFVQRIHERPAYQRALARGGPFEPVI